IISRPEAEDMLNTGSAGSFLIRISEKIKGYVLSFRSEDGYKHFMIDASCNSYSFLGVDQLQHATLADLVAYHKAYHGHFFLNISELFQYTKGSPI
ncbi:hypothetical protein NDU88_000462, partial [Pleurodeles waltl]